MIRNTVTHDWYGPASGVVALLVGVAVQSYILANRVGPRIMWESDACPSVDTFCGVIPLGTTIAVLAAVVTVFLLTAPLYALGRGDT